MARRPNRRPPTRARNRAPKDKLGEALRDARLGVPMWTALPRAARGLPTSIRSGTTQKTSQVRGQVEPMNPEIIHHPILETVPDPIEHPIHQEPHGRPIGEKEMRAMRMAQALDLRVAGLNYREIGQRLGVGVRTAFYDVQTALSYLARFQMVKAEEMRTMEVARLDFMQSAIWDQIKKGDLFAVQAGLRIVDIRAKLTGLYQGAGDGGASTPEALAQQRPFSNMTAEDIKERRMKLLMRAAEETTNGHDPSKS